MRIGIMGAMPEEISGLKRHMTDATEEERGGRVYIQGKINEIDVVVVFSRWGKVAAAITTTTLIERYNVWKIIFTGVAGAVSADLNIGDVVLSEQLYQHDMDGRPIMRKKHEIPLTRVIFFKADRDLLHKAECVIAGVMHTLLREVSAASLARFGITAPKFLKGTIATGDTFISDVGKTRELLSECPEANAVEMEGAAVAQVCSEYGIPFVVIRTISDRADHTSVVDFPEFITKIACHYSEHVVLGMLRKVPNR